MAVNKLLNDENNLNQILHDIANAAENQKKDKFSRKIALIACNKTYSNEVGLNDLP